jgi:GAF domain-containing protein
MNPSAYEEALQHAQTREDLYSAVVNTPFKDKAYTTSLGLGIIVLLLKDTKNKTLNRIALSNTDLAAGAVKMSAKPFHEIKIPLESSNNILIQALKTSQPQSTDDWQYLFTPALTPQEARFNQFGAGIEHSVIYPLIAASGKEPLGAMIFSYFQHDTVLSADHQVFMESIASAAAQHLAKQNR